jgi:hypothetical protein
MTTQYYLWKTLHEIATGLQMPIDEISTKLESLGLRNGRNITPSAFSDGIAQVANVETEFGMIDPDRTTVKWNFHAVKALVREYYPQGMTWNEWVEVQEIEKMVEQAKRDAMLGNAAAWFNSRNR